MERKEENQDGTLLTGSSGQSGKMENGQRKLDLALKIRLLIFKGTQLVISMTKENQPTDPGHTENEEARGTPRHQVLMCSIPGNMPDVWK